MPVTILDNITVIECATFVTGPYATALLADLGARVIKIESPPAVIPIVFAPDPAFSFNFAHLNRTKSLALDLKAAQGEGPCAWSCSSAPMFSSRISPQPAERLGIGYETVTRLNPRLVYCSISAFGQSGPYAEKPGFDTLGQAMSGLLSLLSDPGIPKSWAWRFRIMLPDFLRAMAFLARSCPRQIGSGLSSGNLAFTSDAIFHRRNRGGLSAHGQRAQSHGPGEKRPRFCVFLQDMRPLTIHCSVPEKFWLALLQAADRMDIAEDERV